MMIRLDDGLILTVRGQPEAHSLIEVSADLSRWIPVTTLTLPASNSVVVFSDGTHVQFDQRFYRSREVPAPAFANVIQVSASGSAGAYTFSLRIESPDLGCEQYADWWEVLTEEGRLLYRRVLTHSHVTEQPFTRTGSPVPIDPDEIVWVRAHMHPSGFGGTAWKGSVRGGFQPAVLSGAFAAGVAVVDPLPQGCAF